MEERPSSPQDSPFTPSVPSLLPPQQALNQPLSADWFWQEGWLVLGAGSLVLNLVPSGIVVLMGTIRHGREWWPRWRDPLARWILGLWSIMVVVSLAGEQPGASLAGSFNYWPFWLILVPLSWALETRRLWRWVILSLLIGGLGLAAIGLADALRIVVLNLGPEYRPTAGFTSPNILSVWLVMVLALSGGWPQEAKIRPWIWGLWGLGIPTLILTGSRNSWGIACMGLLVFAVVYRAWPYLWGLFGVVAVTVGAAADVGGLRWVVPSLIWQRLRSAVDPETVFFSSTANRVDAWTFASEMIQQRPWTGWGWQSFSRLYNAQSPPPAELLGHCHNLYLQVAAEGGIPLLLGLIILWLWILGRGWQGWMQAEAEDKPLRLAVNVALICYFLSGFLDSVFLDGRMNLLVWILLASANASIGPRRSDL